MKYPTLPTRSAERTMTDTFRGYNHNLRIADGEFYDMQNMTSDHYPVLSPRKPRGLYAEPRSVQGMIAKEQLCYVDGSDFVIGTNHIAMGLSTDAAACPKQLVSMGAYVIILPDKMYINTMDTADFGRIEAKVTPVTTWFSSCDEQGNGYTTASAWQEDAPDPAEHTVWIDSSVEPAVLRRYNGISETWEEVRFTHTIIHFKGADTFSKEDTLTISGYREDTAKHLNGSWQVRHAGNVTNGIVKLPYVVVDSHQNHTDSIEVLNSSIENQAVTFSRLMPDMDFVIESENRLWGCRYGLNSNGQPVNEIYASKLGDFKNWNCFQGISSDSYIASCGSDGPFTGAITHLGLPLFFKENCVHKVYGNYPANFQIQTTVCRGVQKGCEKSLAIVNETLYYKARGSVCAYDGSLPTEVSYCLGQIPYGSAVGGAFGNKYYLSALDGDGNWNLLVYDTGKRMWHREDAFHVVQFTAWQGELYAIDYAGGRIVTMLGSGEPAEQQIPWGVETGELGLSSADMKYISRVVIRLSMEAGSVVRVYGRYDLDEEWQEVAAIRAQQLRSFSLPIRPRRCDHMKLRIEGEGPVKIYSITKTVEQGSDRS